MEKEILMLDTNIVVDYLRQKPQVLTFIETYGKTNFRISQQHRPHRTIEKSSTLGDTHKKAQLTRLG